MNMTPADRAQFTLLLAFLCPAYLAPCIESGNVVGYVRENVAGQGITVNRFHQPSGGPTKLSDLMPDAPIGTELAFFDGVEWVTAVANEGDDGMIHWFDKRDDHNADAYEVPIGAGYKLPAGERGSNKFGVRLKSDKLHHAMWMTTTSRTLHAAQPGRVEGVAIAAGTFFF